MSEKTYWQDRKNDSIGDWGDGKHFLESYRSSVNQPHREIILDWIKIFNAKSLLEVGCCNAPNLKRIRKTFPQFEVAGEDVNPLAIADARKWLPSASLEVAKLPEIKTENMYDIVLADACLMYVKGIKKALKNMTETAKKGIIIFDWQVPNKKKVRYSYIHPYKRLFKELGWKTEFHKLTKEQWPSQNWEKYGYVIIAVPQ